jgi:hypothetical protein
MQEKIVYLLGAGFSVPLGLPMVSNFISLSKDLYWGDRERFESFGPVFDLLHDMARAKNYYSTNLFSIEEVLSILEMEDLGRGSRRRSKQFIRYICDTISASTPSFQHSDLLWNDRGKLRGWPYIGFLANLFHQVLFFSRTTLGERRETTDKPPPALYSVLTLNYDLVLEESLNALNGVQGESLVFNAAANPFSQGTVSYAKLHGSVGSHSIILPTWNKILPREIQRAWQTAYRALAEATQIRIIGYSLPVADAYVRYLFKAAVLKSEHLKHIDILCHDPYGTVRESYREAISFAGARFLNAKTESYIDKLKVAQEHEKAGLNELRLSFTTLESEHEGAFKVADSLA